MLSLKKLLGFAALSFVSSVALANSPITVVNNTNNTLLFSSSFCGKDTKMCTLLGNKSLAAKGKKANSMNLIAPIDKDTLTISNVSEIEKHKNTTIASRTIPCEVPAKANVVILDDLGTSNIYCLFAL